MKTRAGGEIVLAHGGGGEMTKRLLSEHVLPRLDNAILRPLLDSAILNPMQGRLCMTTDAFVVQPLEFPGGDIGRLAVCGTVNDLAAMGARPVALSLALVLEEGLSTRVLDRVLDSGAAAGDEAGVPVVTGDTKVVAHRRGDGMIIITTGLGELPEGVRLGPGRIQAGDAVLVSGNLAEHGLAIVAAREALSIRSRIVSDVAPLAGLVELLLASGGDLKFLRDPTRGGLAGVLADLVGETGLGVEIHEAALPLTAAVRHMAELLGLDPLTVANEGKLVAITAWEDRERVLAACRRHPLGRRAACIGRVKDGAPPLAELVTTIGGRRVILRPYGEDLPRIC